MGSDGFVRCDAPRRPRQRRPAHAARCGPPRSQACAWDAAAGTACGRRPSTASSRGVSRLGQQTAWGLASGRPETPRRQSRTCARREATAGGEVARSRRRWRPLARSPPRPPKPDRSCARPLARPRPRARATTRRLCWRTVATAAARAREQALPPAPARAPLVPARKRAAVAGHACRRPLGRRAAATRGVWFPVWALRACRAPAKAWTPRRRDDAATPPARTRSDWKAGGSAAASASSPARSAPRSAGESALAAAPLPAPLQRRGAAARRAPGMAAGEATVRPGPAAGAAGGVVRRETHGP